MNHRPSSPVRWLITLGAILVLALPAVPALAQSTTSQTTGQTTGRAQISIDTPTDGQTIRNGNQINVGGWAVDLTGPSTGVDEVRIYLDGQMDSGGTLLGSAKYGGSRPDVAQALGNPAFTGSGFDFLWTPSRLSGGTHTLYVYAHSINDGWTSKTVAINVDAPATPTPSTGWYPGGGYGPGYGGDGYGPGYGPGYGQPYDPGYGYDHYGPMRPPYGGGYYDGGPVCILIYPPPPGCGGPVPPPPLPPYPPYVPPVSPGTPGSLPAPTNVTVSARTGTTVTLTWTPVPGAASYQVYQSISFSGFLPSTLGSQTSSSAVVTGLLPNTTYTFYVVAVGANGLQGAQSAPVTATTTAGP